ncbi:TetR family transcriptional regulator [Rhodococcus sp. HM1]|uniref:TetR family transcriptional regulator n=1 Tax=unclassified Rhodococcus (in: high G+C Gram-positive bacteria) TaxID=192944 RepID=UPI0018CFDF27|nr:MULTISPECIES: TetR family transcriptional regulator [unclassified Rhodococcus (in: high G+C Gram-positive bacteria)]MBH0121963.1 TetR family transcriptional regulator [Rhodococcus sp. CX]MCK8670648.1 TetR family transcriptional regulator [Rhodococcus sp. HM1]
MPKEPTTGRAQPTRADGPPGSGLRPAQRARYDRIIASAKELATEGGYDAVQMRAVAERSGVALGTVYRYFPSKNHLLVVATLQMFEQFAEQFDVEHTPGSSPRERVMWVLHGALAQLEREPRLYDALVRASMFADSSSAAELDRLGKVITGMYARAAGIETITEELENAVRIITDVWMSSLVSWAAGRQTAEQMIAHMDTAVGLVFSRLERLQKAS